MTAQTRSFHLGDILTVTTGIFLSPGRLAGVGAILAWMVGESVYDHTAGRVLDECRPEMLRQHPDLADVKVPDGLDSEEEVLAWLATQTAVYGEYRAVAPLAPEDHTRINPLTELAMKAPHMTVVPVVLSDGDASKISEEGEGSG